MALSDSTAHMTYVRTLRVRSEILTTWSGRLLGVSAHLFVYIIIWICSAIGYPGTAFFVLLRYTKLISPVRLD